MSDSKYNVPNLERALKIIEFLAKQPHSLGTSEIAEKLGYPKNSVFRIVKTLVNNNYLINSNNQYQLSTKFLAVGYKSLGEGNLISKATDAMIDLRDESQETAILGKLAGSEGVVLDVVLSNEPVKFVIDVGHHFQLHTSAPGKAMLAYTGEEEKNEILNNIEFVVYNENTIKNKKEMEKELAKVHELGYAVDLGEKIIGLHCISAPIFNYQKRPIAAIWITGPSYRMPVERLDEYAQMVMKQAARISQSFGYDQSIEE
jgi:DNA-binding IclR family transcriptional regulator